MEPKTCRSLAMNPKIQSNPLILYRSFKYVTEQVVCYQHHDLLHPWIDCLESFNLENISWTDERFYSLLLLLIPLSEGYCPCCQALCSSFLKNEFPLQLFQKFLPKLFLQQTKQLTSFEWKCFRNFSQFLPLTRSLQRNFLSLIRDTFLWHNDRFQKTNLSTIDAETIFIIECASQILFTIAKVNLSSYLAEPS
jgi:hypothetical protein